MQRVRLNSKAEYEKYYKENNLGGSIVCWSYVEEPTHYPCILVWTEVDTDEDEVILAELIYQEDLR